MPFNTQILHILDTVSLTVSSLGWHGMCNLPMTKYFFFFLGFYKYLYTSQVSQNLFREYEIIGLHRIRTCITIFKQDNAFRKIANDDICQTFLNFAKRGCMQNFSTKLFSFCLCALFPFTFQCNFEDENPDLDTTYLAQPQFFRAIKVGNCMLIFDVSQNLECVLT